MTVANSPSALPSDSSPLLPVIALVGRPNVGKSTLFNRLTRSRDALVADFPGLTRDRHYGQGKIGPRPYLVVDTGGFEPVAKDGIYHQMARQTLQAIDESDLVIFLTDARQGITPHDHEIANRLRKSGRPVILAVNKAEGMRHAGVTSEFYELGLGEPVPISSAHGEGVRSLLDYALEEVLPGPAAPASLEDDEFAADEFSVGKATEPELIDLPKNHRIKLAIVGRPNVGKSTLVNSLLGEERVIAFDMPGTTRDSIYIDFERNQKAYTLIDTAGLRKRGKVFEAIEKFSVVKTLQAIADANVVVLLLDASQDVSEQDAHIAGFVLESGRALVVGVNKWDGLDDYAKDRIKVDILRKMQFLNFAKFHFMSALKGFGVGALLRSVDEAHKAAFAKLSTPKLTRELQAAIEHQAPPRKGIFRPKMRYAHQGGQNPPIVIIHGNALDAISDSYKRYLEGRFREAFKLQGTPLRIEMRSTKNPYLDKDK